jgi:hypothetical protein
MSVLAAPVAKGRVMLRGHCERNRTTGAISNREQPGRVATWSERSRDDAVWPGRDLGDPPVTLEDAENHSFDPNLDSAPVRSARSTRLSHMEGHRASRSVQLVAAARCDQDTGDGKHERSTHDN